MSMKMFRGNLIQFYCQIRKESDYKKFKKQKLPFNFKTTMVLQT